MWKLFTYKRIGVTLACQPWPGASEPLNLEKPGSYKFDDSFICQYNPSHRSNAQVTTFHRAE